jgi:sulfite exporter TauE/SafE/copper chaperone CopZ
MSNKKIHITGMHCRSCEILIEEELKKIKGVTNVSVSHKDGVADISFNDKLNNVEVNCAVLNAGYCVGENAKLPYFSKNKKDYIELGIAFLVVTVFYLLAKQFGIFGLSGLIKGNYGSLPVVFIVGLTAGISTCMALVGGLVLGISSKFSAENPEASRLEKFFPHIYFNLGRIASYFVLGGIIGLAGSFFKISTSVLGLLIVAVGFIMLLLGSQLIDIFPFLKTVSFTLPKGLYKFLGIKEKENSEYSNTNASLLGASTFFLPCGFTQAMQLYAISTGSPLQGALTMGVFALGTTPGLLGVGGLTSVIKGQSSKLFFKTAGVIVMLLALFNISNGLNLIGIKDVFAKKDITSQDKNVKIVDGVQIVKMAQRADGYYPNKFTIKKGVPVKWVINSESQYSCASSLISQGLGIRTGLKQGENIFTFTPNKTGTIRFSCSMGMYTGFFNVAN